MDTNSGKTDESNPLMSDGDDRPMTPATVSTSAPTVSVPTSAPGAVNNDRPQTQNVPHDPPGELASAQASAQASTKSLRSSTSDGRTKRVNINFAQDTVIGGGGPNNTNLRTNDRNPSDSILKPQNNENKRVSIGFGTVINDGGGNLNGSMKQAEQEPILKLPTYSQTKAPALISYDEWKANTWKGNTRLTSKSSTGSSGNLGPRQVSYNYNNSRRSLHSAGSTNSLGQMRKRVSMGMKSDRGLVIARRGSMCVRPSMKHGTMKAIRNNSIGSDTASSVDSRVDDAPVFIQEIRARLTKTAVIFFIIPLFISLFYASAILFPPSAREKVPVLLWTDGALIDGNLCPRASICAEGVFQVILISMSRITAFASYVFMGHTFLSKMHCTVHALGRSFLGTVVPFGQLHENHLKSGKWFGYLGIVHTITHFIRWIIRRDMALTGTAVGISGVMAITCLLGTIWSMSLAKKIKRMSYETRYNLHWVFFIVMILGLSFHTPRCRNFILIFSGSWALDYLYGVLFKTYRLDVVEFTPLPQNSGVQMLWRNPPGFNPSSGEFVKVQLPWLWEGGEEWHPFSLYMNEATLEGIDQVLKEKFDVAPIRPLHDAGGRKVVPCKTALIMVEFQHEFTSNGGKLHDRVKDVMESTQMMEKTRKLAQHARSVGAHVFHLPVMWDGSGANNPNQYLGVLKSFRTDRLFVKGSWNAEIVSSHAVGINDILIKGKNGMDGFIGSTLQEELEKHGIETIMLCGFLTNCCVESTMRTGYEKGFNVITLTDGCACYSEEEQRASTQYSFGMFSIPMTCSEATEVLNGNIPERLASNFEAPQDVIVEDLIEEEKEADASQSMARVNLKAFIHHVFDEEDANANSLSTSFSPMSTRNIMVDDIMVDDEEAPAETARPSLIMEEARQEMRSQYNTTQIFMAPAGNWTKQVYEEVTEQTQLRSCWVRGPYISPYAVASDFSHLILLATGIGITPALGIMGQYKGFSRTKILIWSTRCAKMLKFFTPLFKDAHMVIIYYTGKEKLTSVEKDDLMSDENGNIYIEEKRPASLQDVVSTIITSTMGIIYAPQEFEKVTEIPLQSRNQWCMLYCGGNKFIKDDFVKYSKENSVKFEYEQFDW